MSGDDDTNPRHIAIEDEEVRFLAENTDLSPNQAEDLIRRYGRDRRKLLEVARTMKAEG